MIHTALTPGSAGWNLAQSLAPMDADADATLESRAARFGRTSLCSALLPLFLASLRGRWFSHDNEKIGSPQVASKHEERPAVHVSFAAIYQQIRPRESK